ncbi:MAG: CaiB/BaiF CoA transferase family protein [Vicinamibacterales bacterium]
MNAASDRDSGARPDDDRARGGPLAGIRVLDFTRVVAGPYCTMLLGDFGAEVIKVEEPSEGDELRALGPPFIADESVFFLSVNRNKRGIAVDLKDAAAVERLRELVRTTDVIVENFRPGVMDRLGLGFDALSVLNPKLVYCSVSAFAAGSRHASRPGYDLMISGISGLQSMTGEPGRAPLRPGVNLVDLTAGTNAMIGVLLALIARARTGRGQKVEVSLMDGAFAILGQLAAIYLNTKTLPGRRPPEDLHPQIVPYGTFVTADDKYLNICVPNDKFWSAFCDVIGRPEVGSDPRFADNAARVAHRSTLIPLLSARFREEARGYWIERLQHRGIPAGPVNTIEEALRDGYLAEVGMLETLEHPECGPLVLPGIPIRLSETPGSVRRPPPTLGEHNDEILKPRRPVRARKAAAVTSTRARRRATRPS